MFLILSTASCELSQLFDTSDNQTNNNNNNNDNDNTSPPIISDPDHCDISICPRSVSINQGDTASLDITGVDLNGGKIQWSIANGPGGGTWNPSGQDQVLEDFTPDSPGTYNMKVSYELYGGDFTCVCDFEIEVIKEPVVVDPLVCDNSICPGSVSINHGDTASLDIIGVHPKASKIQWTIKNGPGGGTWNPSGQDQVVEDFTPNSSGIYNMKVSYDLYGGDINCVCDFEIEVIEKPVVIDSMNIIAGEDSVTSQSTFIVAPGQTENSKVDIVMVIDNSPSMQDEAGAVQTYINNLSSQMDTSGLDYHFIMISTKTVDPKNEIYGVNVPAPLGTSSRFLHLNHIILSHGPIKKPYQHFSEYSHFLRNNAVLNLVYITDANPKMSFKDFKTKMSSVGKPDFVMHGIVGLNEGPGVHVGTEYINGINETGGVLLDIATPIGNWSNLFDKLTETILIHLPPNTVYQLNDNPIIFPGSSPEQSLTVSINGTIIPHLNNWQYNSSSNTIEFLDLNLLQEGDSINVSYTLTEEIPPGMVYFLKNEPVISDQSNPEASFKVKINGIEIPSPGNWRYISSNNSIQFLNSGLLENGGTIEVEYKKM